MKNSEKQYNPSDNKFFENLIKQLPTPVFWKDREGIFLGCNNAFVKALGFKSSEEIIGKSDYDLGVTQENNDAYRADDKQVIDSGTSKINIQEEQNFLSGQKKFLLTSKAPLYQSNKIIGVLGVNFNITEINKLQESLKKEKNLIKNASESTNIQIQEIISKYDTLQQINEELSDIEILEETIKAYQAIIDSMPCNVYWMTKDCRTAGCNRNSLKISGLRSIEEFKGLDFDDLKQFSLTSNLGFLSRLFSHFF